MDRATIITRKRPARLAALALTATAGLALLPGTPARAATTDAKIQNFSFSRSSRVISRSLSLSMRCCLTNRGSDCQSILVESR